MTPREAITLVAAVRGGCPGMEIVEGMPQLWHEVLEDMRFEDARQAVVNLVRRSPAYIAPADIRGEVRRIRDKRLESTLLPIPPADLTPVQTIAWQRRVTREIADGTYVPPELVGTRPLPAIEGTFRRVDDVIAETRAVLHQETP